MPRARFVFFCSTVLLAAIPRQLPSQARLSTVHNAVVDHTDSALAPLVASMRAETHRRATVQRTHWLRGGLVGGLILGVGSYLIANGFRKHSDTPGPHSTAVLVGVAAGAAGFGIGSLIGGQFAKPER